LPSGTVPALTDLYPSLPILTNGPPLANHSARNSTP
jgi:hypothetical protein